MRVPGSRGVVDRLARRRATSRPLCERRKRLVVSSLDQAPSARFAEAPKLAAELLAAVLLPWAAFAQSARRRAASGDARNGHGARQRSAHLSRPGALDRGRAKLDRVRRGTRARHTRCLPEDVGAANVARRARGCVRALGHRGARVGRKAAECKGCPDVGAARAGGVADDVRGRAEAHAVAAGAIAAHLEVDAVANLVEPAHTRPVATATSSAIAHDAAHRRLGSLCRGRYHPPRLRHRQPRSRAARRREQCPA